MMQAMLRCLCIGAIGVMAAAPAGAQTLSFVFVGPTSSMVSNFGAANVQGGYATGYRGVRITPANLAVFQKVASPNMLRTYNSLQAGQPLRVRIDRVMQISHQLVFDVEVQLVDDRTGLPGQAGYATQSSNSVEYVWPAAWSSPVTAPRKGHKGVIGVGEFWAQDHVNDIGWTGWESVLLHETLHTQFVGEHTKWGSVTTTYGQDGVHYFSEILGADDLPFEEGLGTFYGFTHFHPQGLNSTNAFFSRADDRYIVEDMAVVTWKAVGPPSRSERRPIPDRVRELQPDRDTYTRYYYQWRQVAPRYLMFNEWTSTAFHLYFWRNANNDPDQALRMIDATAGWMWSELRRRNLPYAVNNLALELETFAGTPEGQVKAKAGTLTSSMFPFALLDILTHFGMSDSDYQMEFKRTPLGDTSRALTEYWNHRAAIRKLVEADLTASPIGIQNAIATAHKYCQQASTILTRP
jgi:hypothetical protein